MTGHPDEHHAHELALHDERGMSSPGRTGLRFFRCRCGLEERRRYLDGRLFEVRYRIGPMGSWVDPVAWLSIELPLVICPRCEGQRFDVGACQVCGNLGVLDERCKRLAEVTRA